MALLPFFLQVHAQASGTGTTTRYWDCCKPSCAWPGKATLASGSNPVAMCDINNNPITDYNAVSGCDGGDAYQCSNESPWAVSDTMSYGYAAVNIAGGSEATWCCACYQLTFTSGAVAGKTMIVQATNTGGDLGSNQFDISIPGGGVGIYNGCTAEWGAPASGWGAQYGGISSRSDCDSFPTALQDGCYWRWDWFEGADNPTVSFEQVTCPAALTAKTGCVRADDSISESPTGASVVATYDATSVASAATSSAAATSSSAVTTSSAVVESSSAVESSSVAASSTTEATTTEASSTEAATTDVPPTSATLTSEASTTEVPTSSVAPTSETSTAEVSTSEASSDSSSSRIISTSVESSSTEAASSFISSSSSLSSSSSTPTPMPSSSSHTHYRHTHYSVPTVSSTITMYVDPTGTIPILEPASTSIDLSDEGTCEF